MEGHPSLPILSTARSGKVIGEDSVKCRMFRSGSGRAACGRVLPNRFVVRLESFRKKFTRSGVRKVMSPTCAMVRFGGGRFRCSCF